MDNQDCHNSQDNAAAIQGKLNTFFYNSNIFIILIYQLGEPFDETTPDGREVTAVCTLENGKIISVQKAKKEGDKSTKVYHGVNLDQISTLIILVSERDEWS